MTAVPYGYNRGIPEGTRAAWGARCIFPNDVVHDRTGFADTGDAEAKRELAEYLRTTVKGTPFMALGELARDYVLVGSRDEEHVIYEDDVAIVKANPQASHGYVYVVAYLKAHAPAVAPSG
jgi:hypothetical protein